MPYFEAVRTIQMVETIRVEAPSADEARHMIEDDHPDVIVISDHGGDYEVAGAIYEVPPPQKNRRRKRDV